MLEKNHKRHDCLRYLLSPQMVQSHSKEVSRGWKSVTEWKQNVIGWRKNPINRDFCLYLPSKLLASLRCWTCLYMRHQLNGSRVAEQGWVTQGSQKQGIQLGEAEQSIFQVACFLGYENMCGKNTVRGKRWRETGSHGWKKPPTLPI